MPSTDGLLRIQYMKNGGEPSTMLTTLQQQIKDLRTAIDLLPAPLRNDARNYAETVTLAYAQYFDVSELHTEAASLVQEFCNPAPKYPCSTTTLNNFGVFMLRAGHYAEAQVLFSELLNTRRDKTAVLKQNLKLAQAKLEAK